MTPVKRGPSSCKAAELNGKLDHLQEDKGGLEVSRDQQFDPLLYGESKELLILIRSWRKCSLAIERRLSVERVNRVAHHSRTSAAVTPERENLASVSDVPFFRIRCRNSGSERQMLKCCEFGGWDSALQFSLGSVFLHLDGDGREGKSTDDPPGLRKLEISLSVGPGEKLCVNIRCLAKTLGHSSELLLLHFSSFSIARRLEVTVSSPEQSLLNPATSYSKQSPSFLQLPQPTQVLTVSAPPPHLRLPKRHLPNFLGNYAVPQALRECVEFQKDLLVVEPDLAEPNKHHGDGAHILTGAYRQQPITGATQQHFNR
ncbi:hypothetical protein DNTS_033524 [Danionella cerebrum]|uniref:Uncharacterized protein n=1 Tax=Danionella cerebrum TaxID=2873325 RepID=A0A553NHU4_9TELE|nr:hypothetical protein DNTS_033524 [Danionella translucida]